MESVERLQGVIGIHEGDEQPPELLQKSDLTDITLVVEGKELHFVKFLLIEGSTVLAQMIQNSAHPSRLKLDDVTYNDMILFLTCLHPKCLLKLNDTNLESVASVARKFEYERILRICEQYVMRKFKKVRNTVDRMYPKFFFHLRVADKCGLQQAVEIGVSSRQAELAYYSKKLKNPNLNESKMTRTLYTGIVKGTYGISPTNVIARGYENDIDFLQISWETKFKILSTRVKLTEKNIPVDNPY